MPSSSNNRIRDWKHRKKKIAVQCRALAYSIECHRQRLFLLQLQLFHPEFDTSQFPTSEVDNILDFFREADCRDDAIPPTLDVEYSPLKKMSNEQLKELNDEVRNLRVTPSRMGSRTPFPLDTSQSWM